MDLNVKNVDKQITARLAEQAAAEGISQQEWIRRILRNASSRLSPAELIAQRETLTPMTEQEFEDLRERVRGGRRQAVEKLGASGRRR